MRFLNSEILNTIFSNFMKNFFKPIKSKVKSKILLEKIIQSSINEIDYITKGQDYIILWYKDYHTTDRQITTLPIKDEAIKEQDKLTIKTIIQFDSKFILAISNHLFKTDLKAINLIYTCDENFEISKHKELLILLTSTKLLLMNFKDDNLIIISQFKNPLNKFPKNIFTIESNDFTYILKTSNKHYSLVNISNHYDEKILRLKGFDAKALLGVLETLEKDVFLFVFETFIAKYDISKNELLDLHTTGTKILGYFLNKGFLVFKCKSDNNTYLINLKDFSVMKKLIFPNEYEFQKFIVGDEVIHETVQDFTIFNRDFIKLKIVKKLYRQDINLQESFYLSGNILTLLKYTNKQAIEFYSYSTRKENIKLVFSEIGHWLELKQIIHLNENLIGISFNNKFVIYNYKAKSIKRIFKNDELIYIGKYTNYKLLLHDNFYLYIYDLITEVTFRFNWDEIELEGFSTTDSKYVSLGKFFVYSFDDTILFIHNIKTREHYRLDTEDEITGLYKHYNSDEIIVTYDIGFNILSLREEDFIGDIINLSLDEIKFLAVKANSKSIVFLAESARLYIFNTKTKGVDVRELSKPYIDIISLTDMRIILYIANACDVYSMDDLICLSGFHT
jgi:hypothetical protein